MEKFALTYKGSLSIAGQALNAYDAGITSGGSSSGIGTAVAARVGLGTDTGGSVRVPSALQGLTGLRPSLRLLSQNDIVTLAQTEDRAVRCAARCKIAGYLAQWPSDADRHLRSYRELVSSGGFEGRNAVPIAEYAKLGAVPIQHAAYVRSVSERKIPSLL